MFRITDTESIDYLITGLTYFGTGGGGNPDRGKEILIKTFESGHEISWEDISSADDNEYAATPFIMGSAAPESPEVTQMKIEMGLINKSDENPLVKGFETLEWIIGRQIRYIIPLELGGGSTSRALATASILGLKAIDGDYAGRAVPEITQVTPSIYGARATPIVATDDYGDLIIIKEAVNNKVAERVGKLISEEAYAQVGFPMEVKYAKNFLIEGTLTESHNVGKLLLESGSADESAEHLEKEFGAKVIFKGELRKIEWTDQDYYMIGQSEFTGIHEFNGSSLVVWFKNENHLAFLDGKLIAWSPDLISVLRIEDCMPLTNTRLKIGEKYMILLSPAKEKMRTKEALKSIGKEYFLKQYEKYKNKN